MAEIITENDITDASIGDAAKPVQSMPGRCQDQWQTEYRSAYVTAYIVSQTKGDPLPMSVETLNRVCHDIHNPLHPARNHVIAK